jgi:hypothetical protein
MIDNMDDEQLEPGMLTQGGQGPPGSLGLAIT